MTREDIAVVHPNEPLGIVTGQTAPSELTFNFEYAALDSVGADHFPKSFSNNWKRREGIAPIRE